jgi:hypothetical protein
VRFLYRPYILDFLAYARSRLKLKNSLKRILILESFNPLKFEKMSCKINDKGDYLPFEGFTIISFLKDRSGPIWTDFQKFLDSLPVFNKYYRTLPASSFHMTVKNHISEGDKGSILDPAIQPSSEDLTICANQHAEYIKICKIMDVVPVCKVTDMYVKSSLGLYLNPLGTTGDQGDKDLNKLREILTVLGVRSDTDFKFHLTFAYRFKKTEQRDEIALDKEMKEIHTRLVQILAPWQTLDFESARFCYFSSMKEYIPL